MASLVKTPEVTAKKLAPLERRAHGVLQMEETSRRQIANFMDPRLRLKAKRGGEKGLQKNAKCRKNPRCY